MNRKKYIIIFLAILSNLIIIWYLLPRPPLLEHLSFSQAVYSDDHKLLRLTLSHDDKYRLYTPLNKLPPQLIAAVMLHEDQYYYWHFGVNPISLAKAGWRTYFVRSRRIGASTLTMQLARIIYGINSKTLDGKLLQIIYALNLEMHYSKKAIIEAYLNLIPYGGNIEGVGAASLIYFGKTPEQLSLNEMLGLAIIPQSPLHHLNPEKLKMFRSQLFARWVVKHPEDKTKKALFDLPLTLQSVKQLPFLAPQYVNTVLAQSDSQKIPVISTLNYSWQKIANQVLQNYLLRKANVGISNAAVMLVDSRDMKVKVLIGSSNFFNRKLSGQIDGTSAKRSPGSALKPFIYGLALDQGLIHPATVLKDVPQSFGNYNPENFDNDFVGPIKAQDALILSRNIPAIYLTSKLQNPNLFKFLEEANITELKPESVYGLTLALGGAELTLRELITLYATLANYGTWHPLRYSNSQQLVFGKRLLSPEASFLVLDMLQQAERPEAIRFAYHDLRSRIAWKTGTSSGYRDAWTLGVFGPYVLGVWIGNFDCTSNQALVGREIAAPLFFEIIDALSSQVKNLSLNFEYPKTLQITKVAVCKVSGLLPTRYCKDTDLTWFIPGKSPITTDNIYREVAIDGRTGLRTCNYDSHTRFKIYEFWPSDLLKNFKQAGIERQTPPPVDATCTNLSNLSEGIQPQISSPEENVYYTIRLDAPKKSIIPLAAIVDADVANLYWFANQTYLGKTSRDNPLLWNPKLGKFLIRVIDDHGRTSVRELEVRIASA